MMGNTVTNVCVKFNYYGLRRCVLTKFWGIENMINARSTRTRTTFTMVGDPFCEFLGPTLLNNTGRNRQQRLI